MIFSIVAFTAAGEGNRTQRIQKGDPVSKVYNTLGTPVLEYPLKGQLVQEYQQCTIISRRDIVVSAEYKEGAPMPDTPAEKDEPATIDEIKDLAMQGDAESQYLLAYCFQFGKAIEQNCTKAVRWYRKSAMQGHMPSQHNLGFLYMKGKGVDQDYSKAYMWALLAAESGNDKLKRALDCRMTDEEKQAAAAMAELTKLQMESPSAETDSTRQKS